MTAKWHTMPAEVPLDDETVWVRRWWFGAPWLATWSATAGTFTHASGLLVPWYEISRWKHVAEP